MSDTQEFQRHRLYEDVLALLLGTLFVSFGVVLYSTATLATGSTAGLALLVQYATGYPFGAVFFVNNLPFFALAFARMGWAFTLRTSIAVAIVSVLSRLIPHWVTIAGLNPVFASVLGGSLIGFGVLALFRHRAGLGGINILALYLQDTGRMRAGYFQLAVDAVIVVAALFVLPLDRVLISMLGAAVLNLIVAINHKPGRYFGIS